MFTHHFFHLIFLLWLGLLMIFPYGWSFQGPPIYNGTPPWIFPKGFGLRPFGRIRRNPLRGGRWRDSGAVTFCDLGWPWLEMGKFKLIYPGVLVPKKVMVCALSKLVEEGIYIYCNMLYYIIYMIMCFFYNEMNISLYISCIYKILTNELQNIMS